MNEVPQHACVTPVPCCTPHPRYYVNLFIALFLMEAIGFWGGCAATVTYVMEPESKSVILVFPWAHTPSTLICSNGYLIIPYFFKKVHFPH